MRVAVCGRNLDDLERALHDFPLEVVSEDPELVISYGGDGALLGAERDYPGVPKCPIRDWRSSPMCERHCTEAVLDQLVEGALSRRRLDKLEGFLDGRRIVAGINDVQVSKKNIASAVRYRLWLDDERYKNQIVGDGLVVATPFGSTGYYRSITHSLFRVGLGLAFNNSTEPLDHLVLDAETDVRIEILRGPAVLLADNDPARVTLEQGASVNIRRNPEGTLVLGLDIFRCNECFHMRLESA